MAEATDELSAPLGRDGMRGKRRFRLPFTPIQALAAMLGLFLAAFAGFALFNDDPLGGEPLTRIAIAPSPGGDKAGAKTSETAGREARPRTALKRPRTRPILSYPANNGRSPSSTAPAAHATTWRSLAKVQRKRRPHRA